MKTFRSFNLTEADQSVNDVIAHFKNQGFKKYASGKVKGGTSLKFHPGHYNSDERDKYHDKLAKAAEGSPHQVTLKKTKAEAWGRPGPVPLTSHNVSVIVHHN